MALTIRSHKQATRTHGTGSRLTARLRQTTAPAGEDSLLSYFCGQPRQAGTLAHAADREIIRRIVGETRQAAFKADSPPRHRVKTTSHRHALNSRMPASRLMFLQPAAEMVQGVRGNAFGIG
jgi:hypothetical protein